MALANWQRWSLDFVVSMFRLTNQRGYLITLP
jgi:hypothetical protein